MLRRAIMSPQHPAWRSEVTLEDVNGEHVDHDENIELSSHDKQGMIELT
jgi:hypothetical protein